MTTPEVNGGGRGWTEEIFTSMANGLTIANWAERVLTEYNSLPKQTTGQTKKVKNLIRETAGQLVQNPQNISTAAFVWEKQDSFYELVKEESKTLIRERWEDITPKQLAELVRAYADNPQSQDFPAEMLGGYFNRPKSRRQRIHAYYTFVSSVIDLVGDDNAFTQAIRIGFHDTDILPKDPYLIDQALLLSLPYTIFRNSSNSTKDLLSLPRDKEEEIVFQKLLIAKNVMIQLSFLSLQNLGEVYQRYYDFLHKNDSLLKKWEEEKAKAEKKMGSANARELNKAATKADVHYLETLSGEERLKLKDIWPFNLLFDETDPLNIKFQSALPRITELKMNTSPL